MLGNTLAVVVVDDVRRRVLVIRVQINLNKKGILGGGFPSFLSVRKSGLSLSSKEIDFEEQHN